MAPKPGPRGVNSPIASPAVRSPGGNARHRTGEAAYSLARERYAALGVDAEQALKWLGTISISLHCWQGDDVGGFEHDRSALGGGLAVTGQQPGKARTPDELRSDLEKALALIPGRHRLALHASYGDFGGKAVDRDEIEPRHFRIWMDWARERGLGLDFNPTFFSHPKATDGFTLTHQDKAIRQFWIAHGVRCREIGAAMGKAVGSPCVTNVWIPDGFKDTPADKSAPRERLVQALDAIFAQRWSPRHNLDSVEGKLFGLGSESYVAGSHEFYLGYAITRQKLLCLDAGHFHPTESVADKISAVLPFVPGILLHVSRGVRWDSDHVVTLTDELLALAREAVAHLDVVRLGLDYFDGSINRVAAWVIGARNLQRALLFALLEPTETLRQLERCGDFTGRLSLMEEIKTFPAGAVWDEFCQRQGVPRAQGWLAEIRAYEKKVLSRRVAL